MNGRHRSERIARTLTGWCLVLAPPILLAGVSLNPGHRLDKGEQLAVVAGSPGQWYAAHMLMIVSTVLSVPAIVGLVWVLRNRETVLAYAGGAIAMVGLLSLTGLLAVDGLVVWQMAGYEDRATMTDLYQSFSEVTGIFIPLILLAGGFSLGAIVLAVGLYRAELVPAWTAAAIAVAAALLGLANGVASDTVNITGAALLSVGLGATGWMMLTRRLDYARWWSSRSPSPLGASTS